LANNFGSVDSKFRYIIVAAKRTRQLQSGARPMVTAQSRKFTRIAQEEVNLGLVKFEIVNETKAQPKKRLKESKSH
jgi:DNA-directed RNA polymerase subunit omega